MPYRKRQVGVVGLVVADVLVIVGVLALVVGDESLTPLAIIAFVASILLVVFSFLTVSVDDHQVTAAFLPGWPRHRIALERIADARPVRNSWWYGYGIRKVPGGWMYNVSGLDAVEIVDIGGRRFRIGTREPDALTEAIQRARRA